MKKIFTTLTLSAALVCSVSAQSAWTSHGEINKAPAQEASTRAATGEINIGHCSVNDIIYPYDGLSLDKDARVGVGAILTEDMLQRYVGATIVGMYVGWDDEYSTSNYECFVRSEKFNGETITSGADEVQFGWNYVSLDEVTLTENMKTLAVGFYTDLAKDVCSIPKLYPYGKANSNFLWSGETNAEGEIWYDSKELGSMPIVLVLEDKEGLFHNMISINSCTADCIVEKGELHTAMARIHNVGTNDILNIEVTTTFGEESHTEIIDFDKPIPPQQGGKVLLPVKCLGSGVHTYQITAVNGITNPSNAIDVEMIGVSADVAEKYSYRPLLEYFVSEDNYMTVSYVEEILWPGFEAYQEDITLVMAHLDDKFMTGENDALNHLIKLTGNDLNKVSIPGMTLNRHGYTSVAMLNSVIDNTPIMYTIYPDFISPVYEEVLSNPTFASVNIEAAMDDNGAITVTASGAVEEGVMPEGEDLFLTVYLMEKDVYSEDQRFWDEKEEAQYGGAYTHKNIIREILTPYWGEKLATTGGEYSMTFNTEYYEEWAKDNLYVVAFLNRSGENHQLSMQVINSAEKDLTNTSINRVECLKNVTIENVNGSILVNGDAAVNVYDLSGCQVDNNNLSAGVYIVKAVVNGQAVAQKILVK